MLKCNMQEVQEVIKVTSFDTLFVAKLVVTQINTHFKATYMEGKGMNQVKNTCMP